MQPVDRLKLVARAGALVKNGAGLLVPRDLQAGALPMDETAGQGRPPGGQQRLGVEVVATRLPAATSRSDEALAAPPSAWPRPAIGARLVSPSRTRGTDHERSHGPPRPACRRRTPSPGHRQQPSQRQHHRLSATAWCSRPVLPGAPARRRRPRALNTPVGVQLGNGVRVAGTQKVFTTGSLQTTGQPLDIAIRARASCRWNCPAARPPTRARASCSAARGPPDDRAGLSAGARHHAAGQRHPSPSVRTAPSASACPATPAAEIGQITLAGFVNPAGLLAWATTCTRGPPPRRAHRRHRGREALGAITGRAEGSTCRWWRRWWT